MTTFAGIFRILGRGWSSQVVILGWSSGGMPEIAPWPDAHLIVLSLVGDFAGSERAQHVEFFVLRLS